MAVVVMPGLFVQIPCGLGGDPLKGDLKIAVDQAGLEFGCRYARRGADDEHRGNPGVNPPGLDAPGHFIGDIDDLIVPLRFDLYLIRVHGHTGQSIRQPAAINRAACQNRGPPCSMVGSCQRLTTEQPVNRMVRH